MRTYQVSLVVYPEKVAIRASQSAWKNGTFEKKLFQGIPVALDYPDKVRMDVSLYSDKYLFNPKANYKVKSYLCGDNISARDSDCFRVISKVDTGCREGAARNAESLLDMLYKDSNFKNNREGKLFLSIKKEGVFRKNYVENVNKLYAKYLLYPIVSTNSHFYIYLNDNNYMNMLLVSGIGLLLGNRRRELGLNDPSFEEIKSIAKFKKTIVDSLIKKSKIMVSKHIAINSAFYFSYLIDRTNSHSVNSSEFNGIAKFSQLIAEKKYPEQYIEFLKKHSITVNMGNLSYVNKYFSSWKEIGKYLELKKTLKAKNEW